MHGRGYLGTKSGIMQDEWSDIFVRESDSTDHSRRLRHVRTVIESESTRLRAINQGIMFAMVHLRTEILEGLLDALLGHSELPIVSKYGLMPNVDLWSFAHLGRASTYWRSAAISAVHNGNIECPPTADIETDNNSCTAIEKKWGRVKTVQQLCS